MSRYFPQKIKMEIEKVAVSGRYDVSYLYFCDECGRYGVHGNIETIMAL